jgi:hypothetical protein
VLTHLPPSPVGDVTRGVDKQSRGLMIVLALTIHRSPSIRRGGSDGSDARRWTANAKSPIDGLRTRCAVRRVSIRQVACQFVKTYAPPGRQVLPLSGRVPRCDLLRSGRAQGTSSVEASAAFNLGGFEGTTE